MINDVVNFLQKLEETRHGSLEKARWSISHDEISARCPYCLDSVKDSRKKRFYFGLKDGVFFCHNCQRKGNFAKLLHDFKNISHVDYEKLEKEIGMQKVKDFIDGEHKLQNQPQTKREWVLEFPEGARLDTLFEDKIYKKLPSEDKVALLKVVRYLQARGVKKEWFRYFYFVFPGEEYDQYILTLFEHEGLWAWSGRKIDLNRQGPKYNHLQGFPFHTALGFANEVSMTKGTTIYVVESWFSAMLLNQANLNSVCVFGIMNMKFDHEPLNAFRSKYDLVWLPDNDNSFFDFAKMNNSAARKMKVILTPDKDAGDYAAKLGDVFRKKFLSLPTRSLYDTESLKKLETLI